MKQINSILALIALAALVGCASFANSSGKVLASTAATVDAAMKAFALETVVGKTTPDQQAKVKDAYGKYQLAMAAAESAYVAAVKTGEKSAWAQAEAALTASQSSLLALLASIKGGAK